MTDSSNAIIEEFRANAGQLGGQYRGRRILLLTTTDAATGTPRTNLVEYLPDGARMLVVAAGGNGSNPAWYDDLRAHPHATGEAGMWKFEARVDFMAGDEQERLFARAAEVNPEWAAGGQSLPVVALTTVDGRPPRGPMGDGLIAIHKGFRQELALIRAEVAAAVGSAPSLILQLRINCLTLCEGLGHHHAGEDFGVFPAMERRHPEIAETVARLRREHEVVKQLLDRLQALVSADDADPGAVLSEVDRLITELEAHLDYEEQQLVPILNEVFL